MILILGRFQLGLPQLYLFDLELVSFLDFRKLRVLVGLLFADDVEFPLALADLCLVVQLYVLHFALLVVEHVLHLLKLLHAEFLLLVGALSLHF